MPDAVVPVTDGEGFGFLLAVIFDRDHGYANRMAVGTAGHLHPVVLDEIIAVGGVVTMCGEGVQPFDIVSGHVYAHAGGISLRDWIRTVFSRFVVIGECRTVRYREERNHDQSDD